MRPKCGLCGKDVLRPGTLDGVDFHYPACFKPVSSGQVHLPDGRWWAQTAMNWTRERMTVMLLGVAVVLPVAWETKLHPTGPWVTENTWSELVKAVIV